MTNNQKYKLPCITWVSTGDCPYGAKCQYIHLKELEYKGDKVKTNKTNNFKINSPRSSDENNNNFRELIFYPHSELSSKDEYNLPLKTTKSERLEIFKTLSNNNQGNLDNFNEKQDYSDENIGPLFLESLKKFIQQ